MPASISTVGIRIASAGVFAKRRAGHDLQTDQNEVGPSLDGVSGRSA